MLCQWYQYSKPSIHLAWRSKTNVQYFYSAIGLLPVLYSESYLLGSRFRTTVSRFQFAGRSLFFQFTQGCLACISIIFTSGHREFRVCVCVPLSTYQYVFLIRYLLPRQGNDYVFKLLLTYKWRK